ncbi:MAG: alpha/beta hydrolase [Flavimaricola sp.]|nr:alpha/beta hydrolase [Flavimaricola sp.]
MTKIGSIKIRYAANRNEGKPRETPALERDVTRIEAPVQVLHGECDTFVSVTNSQRLADRLPNSRFAVIPGAAHYAWEDNPSDYLNKVLSLIKEVEANAYPAAKS